jgi:hypothetical protein
VLVSSCTALKSLTAGQILAKIFGPKFSCK